MFNLDRKNLQGSINIFLFLSFTSK